VELEVLPNQAHEQSMAMLTGRTVRHGQGLTIHRLIILPRNDARRYDSSQLLDRILCRDLEW
jgi:hypothetical protein